MKEIFKSYNKKTPTELKQIWTEGLITFDTNILFDLYRQSDYITEMFFKTVTDLKDKIFLTHQVGLEFHKKRYDVISQIINLLNDRIKEVNDFENNIQKLKYYKYFSEDLKKGINSEVKKFKSQIEKRKKAISKLEREDTIYSRLQILFEGKLCNAFSNKEMKAIIKEGENRYDKNIPPGFMDKKKEEGLGNQYGDLIIWKEILKKSKLENKPVIFITNEEKPDWIWKISDKKIIGPLPELIEEMWYNSKMDFSISNFQNFFLSANDFLNGNLDSKKLKDEFVFESIFENSTSFLDEQIQIKREKTEESLNALFTEKSKIESRITDLNSKTELSIKEITEFENCNTRLEALEIQIKEASKIYGK